MYTLCMHVTSNNNCITVMCILWQSLRCVAVSKSVRNGWRHAEKCRNTYALGLYISYTYNEDTAFD